MKLLDLYCCAGGAAMGYHRAGFTEIVGVDIEPQPNFPFQFIQADAIEYALAYGHEFDAIHASPPCQKFCPLTRGLWKDREHPDLVSATRAALESTGKPFVIENVEGAPLQNAVMLCGTMFGLRTRHGAQLRRHRLFEAPWLFDFVPHCEHRSGAIEFEGGRVPATVGVWGHAGGSSTRDGVSQFKIADRREAMGIDWMTEDELSNAIPPAYCHWIGTRLFRAHSQRKRFGATAMNLESPDVPESEVPP